MFDGVDADGCLVLQDREPFVSFEGLEQLHIFLFILGITHVLYSCITVALSMIKVWSFFFIMQSWLLCFD